MVLNKPDLFNSDWQSGPSTVITTPPSPLARAMTLDSLCAKRVIICGGKGFVRNSWSKTLSENLRYSGANIGNLVFQYGLDRIIEANKINIGLGEETDFDRVNQNEIDYIIMPAANHLRMDAAWDDFNNFIRKFKKPLIVLGLGAQAPTGISVDDCVNQLKQNASVVEFARLLDEKSIFVGYRGEFSHQVGMGLGISSGMVIGCPSLFISQEEDLGGILYNAIRSATAYSLEENDQLDFVYLPESPYSYYSSKGKSTVEATLLQLAHKHNASTIQQSGGEQSLLYFIGKHCEINEDHIDWLRKHSHPGLDHEELKKYFVKHGQVFFSAHEWREFMKTRLFSIGHRFHGNMLTIGSNKPGVVVYHDERTSELAQGLEVPRISQSKLLQVAAEANTVHRLLESIEFDPVAFNTKRRQLATSWTQLSNETGIGIASKLTRLAALGSR